MGQAPALRPLSPTAPPTAPATALAGAADGREARDAPGPGDAPAAEPTPRPSRRPSVPWFVGIYLTIVYVTVLDWIMPAGVVVAILLGVPIVLMSLQDDERHVWAAGGLAVAGFVAAALFGEGPTTPVSVFLPNRILTALALAASCGVAVVLQRRRLALARAHQQAAATRDTNRLLLSLLAHDLRAPLVLASEGIAYVEGAVAADQPVDATLLGDVGARLRRSLRSLEAVLAVARADAEAAEGRAGRLTPAHRTTARLREEIAAEVAAFAAEAAERRKTLVVELDRLPDRDYLVDVLVVRQALAILLDNAIRYARPGPVRVTARLDGDVLALEVADWGPVVDADASSQHARDRGLGLGLRLCHSLMRHAGGSLATTTGSEGGTVASVRLPMTAAD